MTTKPLVLDTTYVLPLFGVDVGLGTGYESILNRLWNQGAPGFQIILPASCLTEAYYKLNKEFKHAQDKAILDRYALALPTIVTSKVVTLFDPVADREAANVASVIRSKGHTDVLDCFIAATAVVLKGFFLTEDDALVTLLKREMIIPASNLLDWKALRRLLEQPVDDEAVNSH